MIANTNGENCTICKLPISIGQEISWNRRGESGRYHTSCKVANPAPIARESSANDPLAAILATTIQPYLTLQLDEMTDALEQKISEKIADALANLPKEIQTVYIQSGKTIGAIDGHKHEHFDLLLQLVSIRKNTYLWGEAGSGKSTAAHKIADLLGLPFYYLGLQAQMTESRLMGYMDANGNYNASDFYRAYSQGGIFLLDELELASGNLLGSLNGALANGRASFPCGLVERHPDFVCIATGNTPGLGATVTFSDRRALDASVRDRFHYVQWDTDATLEKQLSEQKFERASAWVRWIQTVRPFVKKDHPKVTCTQRASIEGSELLALGMKPKQVAEMVVFRGYDSVSVGSILAAHPLPIY
jgi:AAA domain (dynein-related subfamily)